MTKIYENEIKAYELCMEAHKSSNKRKYYEKALDIDPLCFEAFIELLEDYGSVDAYKFSTHHFMNIIDDDVVNDMSETGEFNFLNIAMNYSALLITLRLNIQAIFVINSALDVNSDWLKVFSDALATAYRNLEDDESISSLRSDLKNDVSLLFRVLHIDSLISVMKFNEAEELVKELLEFEPSLEDTILNGEADNEAQIEYQKYIEGTVSTVYFEDWIKEIVADFDKKDIVLS